MSSDVKLLIAVLGFLFLAAWLIEAWVHKHDRRRRERDRARERESLNHIAQTRPWWKEPRDGEDDLGDH